MSDHEKDALSDASLDALFAASRDQVPEMSDGFLDRIAADAAQVRMPAPIDQPSLWERALDALGGWPSLGGLATAAVAGVYIGFADPTVLEVMGLDVEAETSETLLDDFAFFDDVTEG